MSQSSKQTIHIEIEDDTIDLHGHPCEFSSYSFIPTTRKNTKKERNFFHFHQERKSSSSFEQYFHPQLNYNLKTHRDDRQHSKFVGLNVAKEEREKPCPSRSSSEYGRRYDHVFPFNEPSHGKIEHVKKDFYRNNGILQQ